MKKPDQTKKKHRRKLDPQSHRAWAYELGSAAIYGKMRLVPVEERPTVIENGQVRRMTDDEFLPVFAKQLQQEQAQKYSSLDKSLKARERLRKWQIKRQQQRDLRVLD